MKTAANLVVRGRSVDVARRRYISTHVSTDKHVNRLAVDSDFAALLYTWMVPHAEDDATITADAEELTATVIPCRRDKDVEDDVIPALQAMERHGLFELWGEERIFFHAGSFYRYQSYIPENKRRSALTAEERREMPKNAASLSPSLSPSPEETRTEISALSTKGVSKNVLGYFIGKIGRDPSESDIRSLRALCLHFTSGVVTTAIGQAVVQKHAPDDFAYITSIAKGESA